MAHKALRGRKGPAKPGVRSELKRQKKKKNQRRADQKRCRQKRQAEIAAGVTPQEASSEAQAVPEPTNKERPDQPEKADKPQTPQPPAKGKQGKQPLPKLMTKAEARQQAADERHNLGLYNEGDRILLVGEGNFSFALSLCRILGPEGCAGGIFATAFDSEQAVKRKYADAAQNRKEIEEKFSGVTLVGVDATRLHQISEFRDSFTKIVFNFPHLGSGEKDVEKSIADHQELLSKFFISAVQCLRPDCKTEIHVALKTGQPYKSWKVVQIGRAACPGELQLLNVVPFMVSAWPGYEHRRTAGFDEQLSKRDSQELEKGAKVYVFSRAAQDTEETRPPKKKSRGRR
mmetsp:Transcript_13508/g.29646  ORF Transcript_13508/g.29646 Transcript_13508/m.29646 type:complete len:345 (-) Transcript_13508:20-1054(-)